MADEFRLAFAAENVEFKAYARHFEHPGEEDEPTRRAVLLVVATLSFPDSGWNVIVTPVEGTRAEEWMLLEDEPPYRDHARTFYAAAGNTDHEIDEIPKTVKIRYGKDGEEVTRVNVVPWD